MNRNNDLTIIQVKEHVPVWGGCLMFVDEEKPWGVQAGMRLPHEEQRMTFVRLLKEDYVIVGSGRRA